MDKRIKELLDYSYKNNLAHIPSALSMYSYLKVVFDKFVSKDDIILLGKPFGAQAYYLIWKELGWIDDIESLSMGVKHDEIDFVDYSEETIGNALGVAIGMALANPTKRVYVNISDATLQMGNTLEAIQFIGQHQLSNIFVTVDYNNSQVTGSTKDIIDIMPIVDMCKSYSWNAWVTEGKDIDVIYKNVSLYTHMGMPTIFFFETIKGYGVDYMVKDPKKWHYKKLTEEYMV